MELCIKISLRMLFILSGSFFFWSYYQEELVFSKIHLLLYGRVSEGLDQLLFSPRRLRPACGPHPCPRASGAVPRRAVRPFLAPSVVSFFLLLLLCFCYLFRFCIIFSTLQKSWAQGV